MKRWMILGLCLIFTGCATLIETRPQPDQKELTRVDQVHLGMGRQQVESLMEDHVNIGYQMKDETKTSYEPVILKNPVRSEEIKSEDKTYQVLYYFTQIKNPDGIMAEEELTPLVFEADKLVSKDWDFVFKLKNKR